MQDFRLVAGLVRATRAPRPTFTNIKPTSKAARLGLNYEKKVGTELERHILKDRLSKIEYNPWFTFNDAFGHAHCSPDLILYHSDGTIIIVEIKLTWVDVAMHKLNDLYSPVVNSTLGISTEPLIICRNITSFAPEAKFTVRDALKSPYRLLHWPENGRIMW